MAFFARPIPPVTLPLVLARVHSFVLVGIDAIPCEVEVDVSQRGLSKTVIVGLAQTAVKESVERVRRAMINSGFPFPQHALLINLAPADVKKEGPALDLPMAVGLLRGTESIQNDRHKEFLVAGELALDGRLRRIKGALSLALLARGGGSAGSSCRRTTPARRPSSKGWTSTRWPRSGKSCRS